MSRCVSAIITYTVPDQRLCNMLGRFGFSRVPLDEDRPSGTTHGKVSGRSNEQPPPNNKSDCASHEIDPQFPVTQKVPDHEPHGAKPVPLRVVKVADKTLQSHLIYGNL